MNHSTSPTIVLDRVSVSFAGRPLFADLSLTLPGGRTTCILGPSGCGKSTLLALLSGRPGLRPKGRIQFEPAPAGQASVAWMGQNDLLLPWMTLLDNVLLGARLRGELSAFMQDKALALIARAGLEGRELTLPSALSGGMRQRAALLRTLMEGRPVILMDEPFSALDALTRFRLQNLASELTRKATVVLVTHDPLEALRLGHRIVVLGGAPATVLEIIEPDGPTPREPGDPDVAGLHARLLARLMDPEAA